MLGTVAFESEARKTTRVTYFEAPVSTKLMMRFGSGDWYGMLSRTMRQLPGSKDTRSSPKVFSNAVVESLSL